MRDPAVMDPSISKVSSPDSCKGKRISSGRTLLQLKVWCIIYPMLMKKTVWLHFMAGSGRLVQREKNRAAVHLSYQVSVSVGWGIQGQCILITA